MDADSRWLISGGSGGIGSATAQAVVSAGGSVALVARGAGVETVAERLREDGPGHAVAIRADLSEPDAPVAVVEGVIAELGGIDVVVNNAASHRGGRIEQLEEADFRHVLEIGLVAPYRLTQEAVRRMDDGGAIVNVGAVVGLRGFAGDSPYGSAKAGLAGLTKVLAVELARRSITANLVVPGFTETEMTAEVDESARESIISRIPLRRSAQPEEIARVITWVAATPYMTGAVIPVDGGLLAGFGSG